MRAVHICTRTGTSTGTHRCDLFRLSHNRTHKTQRELLLAIAWGSFPTIDLVRDTFAVVTLIFAVTFASSILYVTVKCQVLRHPLHHVHGAFAPGLCSLHLRPAPSLVRLTLARTHEHSRILPLTAIEDKESAEEEGYAQSLPPPSQRRSVRSGAIRSGPRVIRGPRVRTRSAPWQRSCAPCRDPSARSPEAQTGTTQHLSMLELTKRDGPVPTTLDRWMR